MKLIRDIVLICSIVIGTYNLGAAQAGQLDQTFGTGGAVVTNFPTNNQYDMAKAIAFQKDGKIVVAGYGGANVGITRYNSDGTLDTTFGTAGFIIASFSTSFYNTATAVGIQSDGKIVVAGRGDNGADYDFGIMRFDSLGVLDSTFGTFGKTLTNFGFQYYDKAYAIAIQNNGKIILGGESNNGIDTSFALARYINGNLDPSFGVNGLVTTDFNGHSDYVNSIAIQSDGKIIAAGVSLNGANGDFALARYDTTGALDNTFGINGKMTTDFINDNEGAQSVAIKPNGKIVLTGYNRNNNYYDFQTAQYNSNGTLDSSFGSNGGVMTDVLGTDQGYSTLIQEDGKILVCGTGGNGTNYNSIVIRYNENGSLDSSFGTSGIVTTSFGIGTNAQGNAMTIQSDGKIVVAGYREIGSNYDYVVFRYNCCAAYFDIHPDIIPHNWIVVDHSVGTPPLSYLWNWGDSTTSTGATPNHIYNTPDYYNICLSITDSNNCASTFCDSSTYLFRSQESNTMITISVVPFTTVSIPATDYLQNNFIVFPNPAQSRFTISSGITNINSVGIYNSFGGMVSNEKINANVFVVNANNLQQGVYLIRCVTEKGIVNKRVVIVGKE